MMDVSDRSAETNCCGFLVVDFRKQAPFVRGITQVMCVASLRRPTLFGTWQTTATGVFFLVLFFLDGVISVYISSLEATVLELRFQPPV